MATSQYFDSKLEVELARDMDTLRGTLAGTIELMGLDEKEERAAIKLVKSLSYTAQENLFRKLRHAKRDCSCGSLDLAGSVNGKH